MRIHFFGAARTVTGSQYLLELPQASFLVDCGMYQGHDAALAASSQRFQFDPSKLAFVLLTHAHIDHCGLLPRLWKQGFRGKIYATSATVDLAKVLLADSAHIQEEDAVFEMRRWRKGRQATPPPVPLYTMADAEEASKLFSAVDYDTDTKVTDGLTVRWVDAGHILGAASLEIWADGAEGKRKLVFSGDIGNPARPILRDPTLLDSADFVVTESTYGNRLHPPEEEINGKLADAINTTVRQNGHIIVPAFAVGRTQELLYRLDQLLAAKTIPEIPVYVDSPLASRATKVFEQHTECYDQETLAIIAAGENPIKFPSLRFTQSVQESQALNNLQKPAIIISAAGMCNAGRIRHHLHHHLEHGNDAILFVGFQAQGTLGRILVEGAKEVQLFGRRHRVRARIVSIRGLSAHADQTGLLGWVGAIKDVRNIFVTHGEEEASLTLAGLLQSKTGAKVCVPHLGDQHDLLSDAELATACQAQAEELAKFQAAQQGPEGSVEAEEG